MQYPLPSAGPTISPAPQPAPVVSPTIPIGGPAAGQPQSPPPLNAGRTQQFRGWYPRWWLLSAMFCGVLLGLLLLSQRIVCQGGQTTALLCQVGNWTDWREGGSVALIWVIFLLGWLVTYVNFVRPIEFKHSHAPLPRFFKWISQFRAVYSPLLIYAGMALCGIIFMLILKSFHPLAFAFCTIVVFVANCQFFHRITPLQRRRYLLGYAILALVCIIVTLIFQLTQPVILVSEAIIVLVGVWAAVSLSRKDWNAVSTQQLTAEEQLAIANEKALEPGEVFRDLIRAIFHR
jgi:hypothetical protein